MANTVAPKRLYIREKLLSALGKLTVSDSAGQVEYVCASRWTWIGESWVLNRSDVRVASSERKLWTLRPTWQVDTPEGPLILRRKVLSLRRRVCVQGGSYDGAELTGTLFDLSFVLTYQGQVLARAAGKVFSMRDCHVIEVVDPAAELLVVILMANVMIDRRARSGAAADVPPGQRAGISM